MADTPKHMCQWKKSDIEKHFKELVQEVKKPKYVCTKCARVASTKKALCKAAPIK